MCDEMFVGNKASFISGNKAVYSTSFGHVELIGNDISFACIGLGRNLGNFPITVTIVKNEFSIARTSFNRKFSEIKSSGFKSDTNIKNKLAISEVLHIIMIDNNNSFVATLIKKRVLALLYKEFKLNSEELLLYGELLKFWREPIIMSKTL